MEHFCRGGLEIVLMVRAVRMVFVLHFIIKQIHLGPNYTLLSITINAISDTLLLLCL